MKILQNSILSILLGLCLILNVKAQTTFNSLDQLLTYTNTKSISLQQYDLKTLQAKEGKLAAILSMVDPTGNVSSGYTNNLRLPVSLFPAEAFGGAAGSFREVKMGVQYNTNINSNLELKLINTANWQNIKLAELNIASAQNDRKLCQKTLYDNIATVYYNVVQLQEQAKATQQNISVADSLLSIVQHKYSQGMAKQQDLNDSKASLLGIQENRHQILFLVEQNLLSLKLLCDISATEHIDIADKELMAFEIQKPQTEYNLLQLENSQLLQETSILNFKKTKALLAPTLSLVLNNNYNQYNASQTVFGGNWINNSNFGFRINLPLPNANILASLTKAKYDLQLANKSTQQAKIKQELEHQQLSLDFDKVQSQYINSKSIVALRLDSYQKNKNLFLEGIVGLEQTLNSFNALVNSQYNLIAAKTSILLAQAKININNHIK